MMAMVFAQLARRSQSRAGGVAMMGADALRPSHPGLAIVIGWSYWAGWSPAIAINAALVGNYLNGALATRGSFLATWLLACLVVGITVLLNLWDIRLSAAVQTLLGVASLALLSALAVAPLLRGELDRGHLVPFTPPGGWTSQHGMLMLAGGLFLAGWSAYGAEISLSYGGDYRSAASAVRSLLATSTLTVALYALVPLAYIGTLGTTARTDPVAAFQPLVMKTAGLTRPAGTGLLLLALFLSVNMIAIGSSRVLRELAENRDAWPCLGRLNHNGVPRNALMFDCAVNIVILTIGMAMHRADLANVPVALLAAANVSYFVSLILALVGARMLHRDTPPGGEGGAAPSVTGLGLGLAAFNALLLLGAGAVWGWGNIALGIFILAGSLLVLTPRTAWRRVTAPTVPLVSRRPRPSPATIADERGDP
jgi:amino acid transporter